MKKILYPFIVAVLLSACCSQRIKAYSGASEQASHELMRSIMQEIETLGRTIPDIENQESCGRHLKRYAQSISLDHLHWSTLITACMLKAYDPAYEYNRFDFVATLSLQIIMALYTMVASSAHTSISDFGRLAMTMFLGLAILNDFRLNDTRYLTTPLHFIMAASLLSLIALREHLPTLYLQPLANLLPRKAPTNRTIHMQEIISAVLKMLIGFDICCWQKMNRYSLTLLDSQQLSYIAEKELNLSTILNHLSSTYGLSLETESLEQLFELGKRLIRVDDNLRITMRLRYDIDREHMSDLEKFIAQFIQLANSNYRPWVFSRLNETFDTHVSLDELRNEFQSLLNELSLPSDPNSRFYHILQNVYDFAQTIIRTHKLHEKVA